MKPLRIRTGKPLTIAGINKQHVISDASQTIPLQWASFRTQLSNITGKIGSVRYGVCYNRNQTSFDYLCGVEVSEASTPISSFTDLAIPAQKYAVFLHKGHMSAIKDTFAAIWEKWLPSSGYKAADTPLLECYDQAFDAQAEECTFEIWIPVEPHG